MHLARLDLSICARSRGLGWCYLTRSGSKCRIGEVARCRRLGLLLLFLGRLWADLVLSANSAM